MSPGTTFFPKRILVATDFGEPSARAVDAAIDLAKAFDASLTIVHSVDIPSYAFLGAGYSGTDVVGAFEEGASESLADALREARTRYPRAEALLRRGPAWQEVLAAVNDSGADLVVIATHGRRGISRALIGSVAERVVRLSPVPVLTIRAEPHAKPSPAEAT
jgi:nucleotide-binding universal stress UspA family protein